jgi:hypothetical protein
MFDKLQIMESLREHGLSRLPSLGEIVTESINHLGTEYSVPVLSIAGLDDFGDIQPVPSRRKLVFPYGQALLKTGHPGTFSMVSSEELHDSPEERQFRRQNAFREFTQSTDLSDEGLPLVRPLCIIHAQAEDEYLLVEPRGIYLNYYLPSLVNAYPERTEELEQTVQALGTFYKRLRECDVSYKQDTTSALFGFEHLVRFDRPDGYEILVTDDPIFVNGYSDVFNDAFDNLLVMTSGKQELTTLISREYMRGFHPLEED